MHILADGTLRALARIVLGDGFNLPLPKRTHQQIDDFASQCGLGKSRPADGNRFNRALWYLQYANDPSPEERADKLLDNLFSIKVAGAETAVIPPKLRAVILTLCDPREYSGTQYHVADAIAEVNRALVAEGLEVLLTNAKPALHECEKKVPTPVPRKTEVPLESPPDFSAITNDATLDPFLRERWTEAQVAWRNKAHLSAIVMMGGVLEGVLLAFISTRQAAAMKASRAPKDKKTGQARAIHEWSLANFIEVGHECGWLQGDVKRYAHSLRESRNIVHPALQRALNERPDEDTCRVSWEVLKAALNDLRSVA
jgi:hypothetical protein